MKELKRLILFFFLSGFALTVYGELQSRSEYVEDVPIAIEKAEKTAKVKPIYLTKADFLVKVMNYEKNPEEWKYQGDKPALIDFYADWCGPCREIAPILEELAIEYSNDIYIYKIDVEKEKDLAEVFGIQSIPSILFVPMEGIPQMARGVLPKAEMSKIIMGVLLKK
ncbi:thioredoxin [Dysgonomonas sp. OttesenSCG-928-M03]|nr:thioredoxin [Dysgonomonas sp. OttesenSCG-928-M03]